VRCGKEQRRKFRPKMAVREGIERRVDASSAICANGVSGAPLPNALDASCECQSRLVWQYVFRLHESNAETTQRPTSPPATRRFSARSRPRALGGLSKRATCHSLRHSFRPHCWRMERTFERFKELLGTQVCRRR